MSYVRKVLLRGWIEGAIGVVFFAATVVAGNWLMGMLDSPGENPWSLLILLLPISGFVIVLWVTARDLLRRDEMEQRCYGLAAVVTLFALMAITVIHDFYTPLLPLPSFNPLLWVVAAWTFWWVCFRLIRQLHI